MRIISLLLTLLIIGYLVMIYIPSSSTDSGQVRSKPKETIDRAEQQVNQAIDDYQKKLEKRTNN